MRRGEGLDTDPLKPGGAGPLRIREFLEAPADRGLDAIDDLLALPIERYPHAELLPRIWELREHVGAYDAAYVALAEALAEPSSPLITTDARLAPACRHTQRHTVLLIE
jgi:predicted nucleic acid-binding protein